MTLIFQPDTQNNWIEIWSAFPYTLNLQMYNRFFVGNSSWQCKKDLIPQITDLGGRPLYGAFIHYPPYTAYYYVVSFTLYELNEYLGFDQMLYMKPGFDIIHRNNHNALYIDRRNWKCTTI